MVQTKLFSDLYLAQFLDTSDTVPFEYKESSINLIDSINTIACKLNARNSILLHFSSCAERLRARV